MPDVPLDDGEPLLLVDPLLLLDEDEDADEPEAPRSTSWVSAPEHALASTPVQVSERAR